MAIIDVVKCEMTDNELCKKFHSDHIKLGSQLIVYPSQVALFVKGGQIYDTFEAGTFTLKTNNIPLLSAVVNLPFGAESPFKAEVWFVNLTSKLDIKWGTASPIQLEDPKYNIIVPVRAFGQYGMRVTNPELFLKTLIGNMTAFDSSKVDQYFKGKMLTQLNTLIATKMAKDGISILEINMHLQEMSDYCNTEINRVFSRYGIELIEFTIVSVNVPEDDPSMVKLKETKDMIARAKMAGRDLYQMDRSFNVLEAAASNEGSCGQFVGIGAGFGFGGAVGNMASQFINTNPTPPAFIEETYYLIINGQQIGGQTIQNIKDYIARGLMKPDTMVWKNGLAQWCKASLISELSSLFVANTPPKLPETSPTYFVYLNGQQKPNQTFEDIRQMLADGSANGDTMIWKPGMTQWMKIKDVPEVSSLISEIIPPIIPPQI